MDRSRSSELRTTLPMRRYSPRHAWFRRSKPLVATTLLGVGAGLIALSVSTPSARLAIGAVFLASLWVASFATCRRLLGPSLDLSDGFLVALGVGTGLTIFTLLVLAALERLTGDNTLAVLAAVLLALGWFGHRTRTSLRARATRSAPRIPLRLATEVTVLLLIAGALAVLSVTVSVRSFRNEQAPLASVFMAPTTSGDADVVSIQDLTGAVEVALLYMRVEGRNLPSATLRLRAGQTSDHVTTLPRREVHVVATVVIIEGARSKTYTLAGQV
jgi:hypothetical protein